MFQTDPGRTRDDPGRTRDFRERLEVGAMLLEFGTDPPRNRPCRCRYATLHPPRIIVLARPDKTGRTATESIDRAISNDRSLKKKENRYRVDLSKDRTNNSLAKQFTINLLDRLFSLV